MSEEAKEARRAYKREWGRKNRAKVNAYQNKWRKDNPEKVAKYDIQFWEMKAGSNQNQMRE